MLYVQFTLSPLVTLKKVTSESSLQFILYQKDMPRKGDEWVTSVLKWITATILWYIRIYIAQGDELQSYVKILFVCFPEVLMICHKKIKEPDPVSNN